MKKFVVLLVVLALTCISTSAFAVHQEETDQPGIVKAEPGVTSGVAMTFSGSIDIRERFYNLSEGLTTGVITGTPTTPARTTNTQERVRFNVDAKVGDYLNGRISFENDWDTFGRNEAPQGNASVPTSTTGRLDLREAWMNFMLPGIPVGVKGGHQLLQLGNGWFFRSMKYGSDAWVVYNGTGNNTLALYDVRVGENVTPGGQPDQDIDFYGILDAYKLADGVISVDLTYASAPNSGGPFSAIFGPASKKVGLYNLGISYAAKTGPIHLKAEIDYQTGKVEDSSVSTPPNAIGDSKFKGYQGVLQGSLPMDPLTINFTLAYGSGLKQLNGDTTKDVNQIITVMDADQHYTLIYEYLEPTGALNTVNVATANESLHTGFANTTAANIGAMFNLSKMVAIGFDYWYLQASEKVAILGGPETDKNLGNEVDFKLNWKLYDNLTWNWQVGWFKHGDAYKRADGSTPDDSTAVLGMLSFKF